jgi:hypothetical protein
MKRFAHRGLSVAVVALTLTMSGCITAQQVDAAAQRARDGAITGCRYYAALDPLRRILLRQVPGLSTAEEIVSALCGIVLSPAPRDPGPPVLAGIPVPEEDRPPRAARR